jgi:hypothetical protein
VDRLQKLARVAMAVGAVGSLVLMFLHGRPSVFLLILFTGWVLAPFIGLAWADKLAACWPAAARMAVYWLMLVVSVGSLGAYGYDVATGYGRAVWFVLVPGVAWVLILLVLPIAVLAGRRSTPGV